MTAAIFRPFTIGMFFLGTLLSAEVWTGWAEQGGQHPGKTWKSLSELSEEERTQIDLSTDTPRHLMSGHIRSGASSPESKLVRDLSYDTPRLMDYSPQELYRRSAAVDTWASTEGHQHLCRGHPGETDREPSRVGAGPGESRGGRQTPVPVAA